MHFSPPIRGGQGLNLGTFACKASDSGTELSTFEMVSLTIFFVPWTSYGRNVLSPS